MTPCRCQWDDKTRPEIYSSGQYGLESIRYTENGWLIYSRGGSSNANANKYSMVRVKTYDADRRALCRRYLTPVGYSENNLFTSSWNTGNWGELDFNSLYAKFYSMYYGAEPLTYNNAGTSAGLAAISGSYMHLVPTEQFERVMEGYLDISGRYAAREVGLQQLPRRVLFPRHPARLLQRNAALAGAGDRRLLE